MRIDRNFEVHYAMGSPRGDTVKDTVYLTKGIAIKSQLFGSVKNPEMALPFEGILGELCYPGKPWVNYVTHGLVDIIFDMS